MQQKKFYIEKKQIKYFFITYGDNQYSIQRKRLSYQAKKFNIFHKVFSYKKSSLDIQFKKRFNELLKKPKGSGYWIWKSQIILQTLEKMEMNDILIYIDSGSTLNIMGKKRLVEYFEMLDKSNESLFLFKMPNILEKHWTTRQVFDYFGVRNDKKITHTVQHLGGVLLVKNTKKSKTFFQEFQNIVDKDNELITDFYSEDQDEYFNVCRHDQSILSVMGKIYGCLSINDESYYFENPEDQYKWPILTVRDGIYNKWQKFKFYILYPLNIRKIIFFKEEPFYFKNKNTVYSQIYRKFVKQ